jgi:hypothetical protein
VRPGASYEETRAGNDGVEVAAAGKEVALVLES